MRILQCKDYNEMSQITETIVFSTMLSPKRVNVSITAGSTPKRFFECITPKLETMKNELQNVHYYNFDEVFFSDGTPPMSLTLLSKEFFEPGSVAKQNIHPMTKENYQDFPNEIENAGGLDLMLIGIGADGHFCANMPGTVKWEAESYCVDTTQNIEASWYQEMKKSGETMSECFVTLGAKEVMKVAHLVLFANGISKAEIIQKALQGPITPDIPASILQLHPNFTVILDKEAAKLLK